MAQVMCLSSQLGARCGGLSSREQLAGRKQRGSPPIHARSLHPSFLRGSDAHHRLCISSKPAHQPSTLRNTIPRVSCAVGNQGSDTVKRNGSLVGQALKMTSAVLLAMSMAGARAASASTALPPLPPTAPSVAYVPSQAFPDIGAAAAAATPAPESLQSKLWDFFNVPSIPDREEITYSDAWQLIKDHKVEQATFLRDDTTVDLKLKDGSYLATRPPPGDPLFVPFLLDNGVSLQTQKMFYLWEHIRLALMMGYPLLVLYNVLNVYDRHTYAKWYARKGSVRTEFRPEERIGKAVSLKKPKTEQEERLPERKKWSFNDVAGIESVKPELMELVAYLADPERYKTIGARVPKGVLLVGKPGCGKTLIARALSGETDRVFIPLGAPEFVGNYVGVGASRVRTLFNTAKANAPCMVFIDEFDAIACQRGYSGDSRADERENTLNQFLVEMDGFSDMRGITILAATNRPHALDEAIMRPGRFDRVIRIPMPTRKGREEILKVHARKYIFANDVKWEEVAYRTTGFTGADLSLVVLESVFDATSKCQSAVQHENVMCALDKIDMSRGSNKKGEQAPTEMPSEKDIEILATHESGHALLGVLVRDYDRLNRIAIAPRGQKSGYTVFIPQDSHLDSGIVDRKYLFKQMVVALGGRVSEQVMLGPGRVTAGAADDFKKVAEVAREYVMRAGYSSALGATSWRGGIPGHSFLQGDYKKNPDSPFSDAQKALIESEITAVIKQAYRAAHTGISRNKHIITAMVAVLKQKHVMTAQEIIDIVDKNKGVYFRENEEIEINLEEERKHPIHRMVDIDIPKGEQALCRTDELLKELAAGRS